VAPAGVHTAKLRYLASHVYKVVTNPVLAADIRAVPPGPVSQSRDDLLLTEPPSSSLLPMVGFHPIQLKFGGRVTRVFRLIVPCAEPTRR
jgi:hypothetical protein